MGAGGGNCEEDPSRQAGGAGAVPGTKREPGAKVPPITPGAFPGGSARYHSVLAKKPRSRKMRGGKLP